MVSFDTPANCKAALRMGSHHHLLALSFTTSQASAAVRWFCEPHIWPRKAADRSARRTVSKCQTLSPWRVMKTRSLQSCFDSNVVDGKAAFVKNELKFDESRCSQGLQRVNMTLEGGGTVVTPFEVIETPIVFAWIAQVPSKSSATRSGNRVRFGRQRRGRTHDSND